MSRSWLAGIGLLSLAFQAGVAQNAPTRSPSPPVSQSPSLPVHFTLVSLAPGIYAAIAKEGDRASVGNAGFVIGTAGVLVVDSFATPEAAQELASEIRKLTPLPVRWVVNTHYHLDHVGGNAVFAHGGAVVLAHDNVRAWVRTENLKWRREIKPEEKAMLAALVLPDITYRGGVSVWPGENRAELQTRPGHTGGDTAVFLPDSNVVFAGDLLWKDTLPNLVDAKTDEWIRTLDGFLADHPAARFVPGHGEVSRPIDVRYFRDYLVGLRSTVERGVAAGRSGRALVEEVLPLHRARFSSWKWFDQFAERNIELTEQELKGTKKFAPTPVH